MLIKITGLQDIENFFSQDISLLCQFNTHMMLSISSLLNDIYSVPPLERSFDNTLVLFDVMQGTANTLTARLQVLKMAGCMAHENHNALHKEIDRLDTFISKYIAYNKDLYRAINDYLAHKKGSKLAEYQELFIQSILQDYYLNGFQLTESAQDRLKEIYTAIGNAITTLEDNITGDNHTLHIKPYLLTTVNSTYFRHVRHDKEGRYVLGASTFIMKVSPDESIRKSFWKMDVNCAYPENEKPLEKIVASRDALAQLLGFSSFAQLDIVATMAHSVARVEEFLELIIQQCHKKIEKELALLTQHLPEGVTLTSEGKIKPWDRLYIKNYYEKHVLGIDQEELADYFPLDHVLKQMCLFYQEFFTLTFKEVSIKLWHSTVKTMQVSKNGYCLGVIVFDLLSRPHKYVYTLEQPVISSSKDKEGTILPGLTVIFANFSWPTDTTPSLLTFDEASSLFHECGHALHTLLGAQPLSLQSGTHVKRDFVEMPSQMLQQFFKDSSILKKVSCHYKTLEPLPDSTLVKLERLSTYDSADLALEQCYLAMLSLSYFKEGSHKDLFAIHKRLYTLIRINMSFDKDNHSYASFDHLASYGAKYYTYLWTQVFAIDIFDHIKMLKSSGMSLQAIGTFYYTTILSYGGSCEPSTLLTRFLGRKPSLEPFLKTLNELK
jgi:thimet oligopeptidase